MKTIKLALLATLVAFAMATAANAEGLKINPKPGKVIILSLEKAMSMSGLAAAMYEQIDRDHFLDGNHYTYVAEINYNGIHYRVKGTLLEWIRFFRMQGDPPCKTHEVVFGTN